MLALILAAGVFLRAQVLLGTEVVEPLQAESAEAFALAQTLSSQGALQVLGAPTDGSAAAAPEVTGDIGYPLFLSLFADTEAGDLTSAKIAQLVLGALAILLVYLLGSRLMDPYWGLTAALLTAVSPYLVNVSLFLVSASLVLVALLLYLVTAAKINNRWATIRTFIAAALLGLVALIDSTYQLLILPWVLVLFSSSRGVSKLLTPVAALLGFALVFGPWVMRNQEVIEAPISTAPIAESIQQGLPPVAEAESATAAPSAEPVSLLGALGQLGGRFIDDPREFLSWYFVDKPQALWSLGEPSVDQTFVYPVSQSPYNENALFIASEDFMQLLHLPLVLIAAFGAILVWLPFVGRRLTPTQRIGLRSLSLVLLYATLAKLFGGATPVFATSLLPLLFVMALTPFFLITTRQLEQAPPKVAKVKKGKDQDAANASEAEAASA
jgi:hypothetical protein